MTENEIRQNIRRMVWSLRFAKFLNRRNEVTHKTFQLFQLESQLINKRKAA